MTPKPADPPSLRRALVSCAVAWASTVVGVVLAVLTQQWLVAVYALLCAVAGMGWLLAVRQWILWRAIAQGMATVLMDEPPD